MPQKITKAIKKSPKLVAKNGVKKAVNGKADSTFTKAHLAAILANLPGEWRGTTFKNSALLGREKFAKKLLALIAKQGTKITAKDLTNVGNAEDYLRVSSNISSVLECYLATLHGRDISTVFTFSSRTMPYLAVLLTAGKPVHLYVGKGGESPITPQQLSELSLIGCSLTVHQSTPKAQPYGVVLSTGNDFSGCAADGIVHGNTLYINNTAKILPGKVLVVRKRMGTPLTTPVAIAQMQKLAGVKVDGDDREATQKSINNFYAHLQTLSGVKVNPKNYPVCFTAGLPAICSVYMALLFTGGADILMASTAYGGSSELTDLLSARSAYFNKHKFDITGTRDLAGSIQESLDALSADPAKLMPTTVLFVEIPTNPDMKVPDILLLAKMCSDYKKKTQKEIILMVDTTFAPHSQVMKKIGSVAPGLNTLTFISMSKSVSRGMTTAGAIVAGPTKESCALLEKIREVGTFLDTTAKKDQLYFLAENHTGVEDRCNKAYKIALAAGEALQKAVKQHCHGYKMPLAFVSSANAALGFTSSTFSFNLPAFKNASPGVNAALAQRFTDLLTVHSDFKPCVSFGQDNGLVYATVPATSTQGAIKAEDKAKQAVGGVQLVRLSFPPTCNEDYVCSLLRDAVRICYTS